MVGPHVHPAGVGGQIVDPVRGDLAEFLIGEVVIINPPRRALRLPFGAAVFEVADQLFLLAIDRDHRDPGRQAPGHQVIDVAELGVAVRVLAAFDRLGVALQAVAQPVLQQPAHRVRADRPPRPAQLTGQVPGRLGCPHQRLHRISPGLRLHQLPQRSHQPRIQVGRRRPPRARLTDPPARFDALLQLARTPRHRVRMRLGQSGHPADPAPAQRPRLRAQRQPPLPLVQMRLQLRQHGRETILINLNRRHTTHDRHLSRPNPPNSAERP